MWQMEMSGDKSLSAKVGAERKGTSRMEMEGGEEKEKLGREKAEEGEKKEEGRGRRKEGSGGRREGGREEGKN